MGFYPQPNQWLCGPFALKFALLILGIFEEEGAIARAAGTDESGTDENDLARAAERHRCELLVIRHHDPDAARRDLVAYLRRRLPVLLCVNEWNHWVTAVEEEHGRFVLLDSHDPGVLRVLPWEALRRVLGYHDQAGEGAPATVYDLHPVVPRRPPRARARLSVDRARYLGRPENRRFAWVWSALARDLLRLSVPGEAQIEWSIPLGMLLRREEATVLDQLDYGGGSLDREVARRLLEHLRFAAETYDLAVRPEDEAHAISGVGAILARWAAGGYGFPGRPARPSAVA